MNFIGTRFDRCDDQSPTGAPELCGSNAGLDAELVDGIRRREEDDRVDERFVVVNAIEDEVVVLRPQAVYRESGATGLPETVSFGIVVCPSSCSRRVPACDTGHEQRQLREVAPV